MASTYAKRAASIAEAQHVKYHLQDEADAPLSTQIKKYWTDLSLPFPGVETPWSAVFVSWCMKSAGATDAEFKFSPRHGVFVKWAIKNQVNTSGLFRGRRITKYAPNVGDIIHNNRNGHNYDYDFAANNAEYESHTAIVVETGSDSSGKYALTIGGNESDSIRRKLVRLDAQGLIKQRQVSSFICIIQNLK